MVCSEGETQREERVCSMLTTTQIFPHKEEAMRIKTTTNSDASSQGRCAQHGKHHIGMFQFASIDFDEVSLVLREPLSSSRKPPSSAHPWAITEKLPERQALAELIQITEINILARNLIGTVRRDRTLIIKLIAEN